MNGGWLEAWAQAGGFGDIKLFFLNILAGSEIGGSNLSGTFGSKVSALLGWLIGHRDATIGPREWWIAWHGRCMAACQGVRVWWAAWHGRCMAACQGAH